MTDEHVAGDLQAIDREHRTQQDAMRATITRLTAELRALQELRGVFIDSENARLTEELHQLQSQFERQTVGGSVAGAQGAEIARLRNELREALNGRDSEYNRAEAEREAANEWLGQLTDAKKLIEETRGFLGAAVGEYLPAAARRVGRLAFDIPVGTSRLRAENKRLRIELTAYEARDYAALSESLGRPEPGTLAEVFTRPEPVTSKGSNRKKSTKKASKR